MWNSTSKKLSVLMVGILCVVQFNGIVPTAEAQTIRPTSGKNQCSPQEAFRNWSEFLAAVVSYEGFTEYWKEVMFFYNSCQYNDIVSVHKQIDALEKRIRTGFYSCNNKDIDKVKPQYFKARAELFYVRNFVETKDGKFILRNEELLKKQMEQQFVVSQRSLTLTELEKYYQEFKKKYQSKTTEYAKCDDNQWKEVAKKWKELRENFKNLGGELDKELKEGQKKLAAEQADKAKNAPKGKAQGFLERTFAVSVNGQTPAKGFAEIGAAITKQAKSVVPKTPTLNQLGEVFAKDQQVRLESISKKELLDRYQTRYKQSGDDALADLVLRLQGMNTIVKDTIPVLAKLGQCSQKIGSKQCK